MYSKDDVCYVINERENCYFIQKMKFRDCWYVQHSDAAKAYDVRCVHEDSVEGEDDEFIPSREYYLIVRRNDFFGNPVTRDEYATYEEARSVIDHWAIFEVVEESDDLNNVVFLTREDAERCLEEKA